VNVNDQADVVVKLKSGSPFEDKRNYSRAVVIENWILVSNTAGRNYQTRAMSDSAAEQAKQCIKNIAGALAAVGSELADIVRIRVSIPYVEFKEEIMEVVAATFKGIEPASTVTCSQLAAPEYKVEIEVTAYKGASRKQQELRRVAL
jgi:enamine deaminase RidA (YjgF/YER057c/UK114 family)